MAQFELPIYGNDDEIIKTFSTDKVRWGVYLQALELDEELEDKSAAEQFKAMSDFIKKIFPTLTDADLENADGDDVINTFKQFTRKAERIAGSKSSKNARGAAK